MSKRKGTTGGGGPPSKLASRRAVGAGLTRDAESKRKVHESKDDDVKRQIDGDPNNQRPIYRLVDVKTGGGKLIELIKTRARQHSNESQSLDASRGGGRFESERRHRRALEDETLDEQIRKLVEPLLYNGGRGKLLPLERLWAARLGGASLAAADATATAEQEGEEERATAATSSALDSEFPVRAGSKLGEDVTVEGRDRGFRWTCWRLDERGFVGETALHICFLLSSQSHMMLARKLLRLFPALINDTYTCDEYFGESSLHMAIVNEDVKIVKLLLDHGANAHERCLGTFFLPDDQKASANSELRRMIRTGAGSFETETRRPGWTLESNQFHSPETNYEAFTYWGEYPLSFAASLGLADCYRLLLAKGADPDRRDSNGNSTLHICVIADRRDMFDLCYAHGARLDSLNALGLSPLTLAARLKRVAMFFHILNIHRQLTWTFCRLVAFLDFPLERIDSISARRHGSCDPRSALSIVVAGNSNEHLQMLDGLLADLLQVKWATSLRNKFCSWLIAYLLLLTVATLAYVTRFLNSPAGHERPLLLEMRYACELLLIACVLYYLALLMRRCLVIENDNYSATDQAHTQWRQRLEGLLQVLAQAPELTIFTFTCLLILACIPMRALHWSEAENSLAALVIFLLPLKLLFFCRGSKSLGSFILMIYKILVNDVLRFVVFLLIFVSGFAQSFLIIFKTYRPATEGAMGAPLDGRNQNRSSGSIEHSKQDASLAPTSRNLFESIVRNEDSWPLNLLDALITMQMMALNEFSWVADEFARTEFPSLAKCLFCIYMILVSILLINMLIAMLGKTYQDISSQPNENLRQWARALLALERFCSPESRLAMLHHYSYLAADAATSSSANQDTRASVTKDERLYEQQGRIFSSTWALDSGGERLSEIEQICRLKREHEFNRHRLRSSLATICH